MYPYSLWLDNILQAARFLYDFEIHFRTIWNDVCHRNNFFLVIIPGNLFPFFVRLETGKTTCNRFHWSCVRAMYLYVENLQNIILHDDVIKWKYFPRYWPFVWPVNSPHKGQWRGENNRDADHLWCHRAHCDVTVMFILIHFEHRYSSKTWIDQIWPTLSGNCNQYPLWVFCALW